MNLQTDAKLVYLQGNNRCIPLDMIDFQELFAILSVLYNLENCKIVQRQRKVEITWMGEHDRTLILFLFWLISKSYNFLLTKLTNLNILEKL